MSSSAAPFSGRTAATALLSLAFSALAPSPVLGCAACYGQSDSPLAAGMNWGIFTLLGFILLVLAGIASVGIFLARRAAVQTRLAAETEPADDNDFLAAGRRERGVAPAVSAARFPHNRRSCRAAHGPREEMRLQR